jgi:secreted PhoX family phosphatase
MLKATRARGSERRARSGHSLILTVLLGVTVLAVSSTGRTDDGRDHDHHNEHRRAALWVANGGGPNVLEFSSDQFNSKGIVSGKPHRINASGVFVNPQDTVFDRAGNLWVVDGGNGVSTGEGVFEFTRGQINRLKENPHPTPVFAITNSDGVPGFVFPQFAVFDKAGDLFVEDTGGNLIDAYSAQQLLIFKGTGLKPACVFASTAFVGPLGAIFDKENNLFVAQNGDSTIVRINATDLSLTNPACNTGPVNLTPEVILSSNTSTPPSINGPWGLAFASDGNLWVSNEQNIAPNKSGTGTLVVFAASDITTTHTPTPLVTLTTTTLDGVDTIDDPQGISFNSQGDLAVANDADSTIAGFDHEQLTKTGSPVPQVFFAGTNTMLNAPTGLIFGPDVR